MSLNSDSNYFCRPQKRRAYLVNLFNAISIISKRKEETLHESLANFVQKVFAVMGIFAFENETKTLLKVFLTNLSSESAIIRRSSATAIAAIISNNQKSDKLLALVLKYLTGKYSRDESLAIFCFLGIIPVSKYP